jgi:hypothetical protein
VDELGSVALASCGHGTPACPECLHRADAACTLEAVREHVRRPDVQFAESGSTLHVIGCRYAPHPDTLGIEDVDGSGRVRGLEFRTRAEAAEWLGQSRARKRCGICFPDVPEPDRPEPVKAARLRKSGLGWPDIERPAWERSW